MSVKKNKQKISIKSISEQLKSHSFFFQIWAEVNLWEHFMRNVLICQTLSSVTDEINTENIRFCDDMNNCLIKQIVEFKFFEG